MSKNQLDAILYGPGACKYKQDHRWHLIPSTDEYYCLACGMQAKQVLLMGLGQLEARG